MELAIINGTYRNSSAAQTPNAVGQLAAALSNNKAGFLRLFMHTFILYWAFLILESDFQSWISVF